MKRGSESPFSFGQDEFLFKKKNLENVQIQASNAQINQRIRDFIEKKEDALNQSNTREYMDRESNSDEGICSRTSTKPVERNKIKVYGVVNSTGPNCENVEKNPNSQGSEVRLLDKLPPDLPPAVEQRLNNLEVHLYSTISVRSVPKDVYARIKRLEDRVLALERKNRSLTKRKDDFNDSEKVTEDLDEKILELEKVMEQNLANFDQQKPSN